MLGKFRFNSILEKVFSGKLLTEEDRIWAEQVVAFKEATSGQIRAYEIATKPGFDLKQSLLSTIEKLEELLKRCPQEGLNMCPAPNKWSVHQIIGHLADNEVCNSVRVRCILTEDCPNLVGYDSDDWERWFRLDDVWTCFTRFKRERMNLLAILDTLHEEEWNRVGYLDYRGNEQLRVLLGVLAGHDENHIDQMKRTIEYVERALDVNIMTEKISEGGLI